MEKVLDRYPHDDGPELWAVDAEDGGLEGWAVTYRETANYAGRIIVPGTFKDSLKQRPSRQKPLPMGYEHSSFQGTNVIGGWGKASDDPEQGVFLSEGKVSDTSLGRDAQTLVRDRALNGLSIGFRPSALKFGAPGETMEFKTPYGKRSYEVDPDGEGTIFVTKGDLLETSIVSTPADDEGRLTKIQRLSLQAQQALPGLRPEAEWDELAYSMALLMGGRGAGSFSDLPELERIAMYQSLAQGYVRAGKTPPPYETKPDFKTVPFLHDEREQFSQRYVTKRFADLNAGIRGLQGGLSREGCAMAMQTTRELVSQLTQTGPLPREQRAFLQEMVDAIQPLLAPPATLQTLASELSSVAKLIRSGK